jgi:arylsulfatase A-like enzyme/tetratricopeptide (TPR) repeat protein
VTTGGRRLAAILALGLPLGCAPETDPEPRPRPVPEPTPTWEELAGNVATNRLNVVLVTIDTLRADRLSSYGSEQVSTPHMDRLAREGLRFSNAATAVPFTLPAHSSIMTGTYPPLHGVRENVGYSLDETLPTLAEELSAGGWDTAGFVSAFVLDSRWGIGRGFDRYRDDFQLDPNRPSVNVGQVQHEGPDTIEHALAWLDEPRDGPFFLWVHLFEPHDPYEAPEPYRSRYPDRPYDAEVAYADSLIGLLREGLESRGVLDDSVFVLTSDHGEGLGQHSEGFHGYFIYDSTVHVPLVLRLPFGDFEGRVVDEAVSHVDILPTVLGVVGRQVPSQVQGIDLLPLILGREPESPREVYTESYYSLYHYNWAPLRSIRTESEKFIETTNPELYLLREDAGEESNALRQNRDLARSLRDRLLAYSRHLKSSGERPGGRPDLDTETLAQLRALGYLAGRTSGEVDEDDGVERTDPKDRIAVHRAIMEAQSFIGRGDEEGAEEYLRAALELDASIVDANQMLGGIVGRRADEASRNGDDAASAELNGQALELYQRALALNPEHQASLLGLATSYWRLGRLEEALVGFHRLVELAPYESNAAIAMSDIYASLDRLPDALRVVEAAAADELAPAWIHNQHGELLALLGRSRESAVHFERAIAKNPEIGQPYFNLALTHEEAGRSEDAVAAYEQAIENAPYHYRAQFNLGHLYGRLGQPEDHLEMWRTAIRSNPEFVLGYHHLGKLHMDRGDDLGRAELLVREGLRRDPEGAFGPFGYFVLADILNRQGRLGEAREAVENGRRLQARR